MTDPNRVERRLVDWLGLQPDRMPEQALADLVATVRATPQRRTWLPVSADRVLHIRAIQLVTIAALLAALAAGTVLVGQLVLRDDARPVPAPIDVLFVRPPASSGFEPLDGLIERAIADADGQLVASATTIQVAESNGLATQLDTLAERFDVVITTAISASDPLREELAAIAASHPATTFVIFSDQDVSAPNVAVVQWRRSEGGYLAGIFAASIVDGREALGFLGGDATSSAVDAFERGFRAGATDVAPAIRIAVERVGFIDSTGARAAMGRLLDDGARVVFQAVGPAGADAIGVAADRDRFVIGVDIDQSALAPDVVIASVRIRADVVAARFMRAAGDGEIEGGIYEFGVADGAIDLIYNPALEGVVPASARDRIDQAIEAIRSGELRMETQP